MNRLYNCNTNDCFYHYHHFAMRRWHPPTTTASSTNWRRNDNEESFPATNASNQLNSTSIRHRHRMNHSLHYSRRRRRAQKKTIISYSHHYRYHYERVGFVIGFLCCVAVHRYDSTELANWPHSLPMLMCMLDSDDDDDDDCKQHDYVNWTFPRIPVANALATEDQGIDGKSKRYRRRDY